MHPNRTHNKVAKNTMDIQVVFECCNPSYRSLQFSANEIRDMIPVPLFRNSLLSTGTDTLLSHFAAIIESLFIPLDILSPSGRYLTLQDSFSEVIALQMGRWFFLFPISCWNVGKE